MKPQKSLCLPGKIPMGFQGAHIPYRLLCKKSNHMVDNHQVLGGRDDANHDR
jgi:hypothetical protein